MQSYTEKIFMTPGSITMNNASGGDGISVELFQILKDDAVKVLHTICQKIWKTQKWTQDWKRLVFILIPKKSNAKECSNYHTISLMSYISKVMLKNSLSQASTIREPWTSKRSCWILKRQRNQRSNCQHLLDHQKSKRIPEKRLVLLYWLRQSLDCLDHNKLENSSRDRNTRAPDLPPEKSVWSSRSSS